MAKTEKRKELKYEDKSAGQPEMISIFNEIKKLMSHYVKGNYVLKTDKPGVYEIYYDQEVEVAGRKYPELCFSSLLIQKGYTGFYFFPIYMHPALKNKINPLLLEKLKGKTCFHIKKADGVLLNHIEEALKAGYAFYTSKGWK